MDLGQVYRVKVSGLVVQRPGFKSRCIIVNEETAAIAPLIINAEYVKENLFVKL